MITLGLNGWTIGSHDASAALVADGRILGFCEEERFTRRKHAVNTKPHNAVAACLHQAGLKLADVDQIATGWDYPARHGRRNLPWGLSSNEYLEQVLPPALFGPRKQSAEHVFIEHHLAHAASAYFASGFDRATIVVLDGQGEEASGIIASGVDHTISIVNRWDPRSSLGYFYEAACSFAGFDAHDGGKLMGLAAHGTIREELLDTFSFDGGGYIPTAIGDIVLSQGRIDERRPIMEAWHRAFSDRWFQTANTRQEALDPVRGRLQYRPVQDPYEYRDFAATVQYLLEQSLIHAVRSGVRQTGINKIVLAGGVALNAAANRLVNEDPANADFWVQPAAGDAGVSLGAALYAQATSGIRPAPMRSASLGMSYAPEAVKATLDRFGCSYIDIDDPSISAAKLLHEGLTVAWFQGRAEVGPRALGNRSLLSNPVDPEVRRKINGQIKEREWWRPLAISLLADDANNYLSADGRFPFMIITCELRPEHRSLVGAAIHEDGSTRPQTVAEEENSTYYNLLRELRELTGHGLVLNTSLNGTDEPICNSPADALRFFATSQLDACVIGPYLLRKQQ